MKFYESLSGARKPKPRDLHIRKVSFSGCSVTSGSFSSISSISSISSASSSSSTFSTTHESSSSNNNMSSPSTRATSTASSGFSFDPLASHPTFKPAAPPRLHNRPFIPMEGRRYQDISAFYDDSEDDKSETGHEAEESESDMGSEYYMGFAKRSQLPSSRWSDSTIASQDLEDLPSPSNSIPSEALMILTGEEPEEVADDAAATDGMAASAKRPAMKHMDSFHDYVKRGGWKRRGIVFHQDDMSGFEL